MLLNRYRLEQRLGEGGMGIVHRAEDVLLQRTVAVKTIQPHLMQSDEARTRFLREARSLAGLTHPNIVTIHDLLDDPETGNICIVMELLEGASLRQAMQNKQTPPFITAALQMCDALHAAHQRKILHRDIKPENIFVCSSGTLKLMDFGLARLLAGSTQTHSGIIAGTLAYMSPEQLRDEPLDERSDLYSLGVVFYEMLTGLLPFASDNPGAMLVKRLTDTPSPVLTLQPALSPAVAHTVDSLLAISPQNRPASAAQVSANLQAQQSDNILPLPQQQAAHSNAVTQTLPSRSVNRLPFARGYRATAIAAGLAFIAAGCTLAYTILNNSSKNASTKNMQTIVQMHPHKSVPKHHEHPNTRKKQYAAKTTAKKPAQPMPPAVASRNIEVQLQKQNNEILKLQKQLASQKQQPAANVPVSDAILPSLLSSAVPAHSHFATAHQPARVKISIKVNQPQFLALYAVTRRGDRADRVRVAPAHIIPSPEGTGKVHVILPPRLNHTPFFIVAASSQPLRLAPPHLQLREPQELPGSVKPKVIFGRIRTQFQTSLPGQHIIVRIYRRKGIHPVVNLESAHSAHHMHLHRVQP